jgi:two-component system sensor histidine kinase BaeS
MEALLVRSDASSEASSLSVRSARPHGLAIVGASLLLATATQALLFRSSLGLGWAIVDALLVAMTFVVGGRTARHAAAFMVAAACLALGAALVVHASDWAVMVAFPANVAFLALLAVVALRPVTLATMSELPARALTMAKGAPVACGALVQSSREALASSQRARVRGAAVGLALGLPLSALFVALLAADPGFAHALGRVAYGSSTLGRFAAFTVVTAVGYAVAFATVTWPTPSAAARVVVTAGPYRTPEASEPHAPAPWHPFVWAVVLAQLVLVFGAYVASKAHVLFAGHAFLQSAGTTTYAQHLHAGFFQVAIASTLALVVVLLGHHLLGRDEGRVRGGRIVAGLEVALLLLTALSLASSWQRLALYEEAYGYTYLRLGVTTCQYAVFVLLALTLVKSATRRFVRYGAAVFSASLVLMVLAGSFDADGYIVRENLRRVARADVVVPLDLAYLARLSTDGNASLGPADPSVAEALRTAWRERRERRAREGWRAFRGF